MQLENEIVTVAMDMINEHCPEFLASKNQENTPLNRAHYYEVMLEAVKWKPLDLPLAQSLLELKLVMQITMEKTAAFVTALTNKDR